jgi:hypothetical protein
MSARDEITSFVVVWLVILAVVGAFAWSTSPVDCAPEQAGRIAP